MILRRADRSSCVDCQRSDLPNFLHCYISHPTCTYHILSLPWRQMWQHRRAFDSCASRNWYRRCRCPQEVAQHGWYRGLLHAGKWGRQVMWCYSTDMMRFHQLCSYATTMQTNFITHFFWALHNWSLRYFPFLRPSLTQSSPFSGPRCHLHPG